MPVVYKFNRSVPALGRRPFPLSLQPSRPGKEEGLLISPTSGRGNPMAALCSPAHFWLGVGLILSAFNLVFALISLILF